MASKLVLAIYLSSSTASAQDPCRALKFPTGCMSFNCAVVPACCPDSSLSCASGCPESPWCGASEAIAAIEECGQPAAECAGSGYSLSCLCKTPCFASALGSAICSVEESSAAPDEVRNFPDIIKKLACEMATKKQIEDKSVGEVCKTICATGILKKMEPLCETTLDKVWEGDVAKICPKPVDTELEEARDLPAIIEKLFKFYEKMVCKMATQKEIEDKSVGAVCKKVCANPLLQKLEQSCETHMDQVWEQAFKNCPKSVDQELEEQQLRDVPAIIKKLACAVAKNLETKELPAICKELCGQKFPKFEPICEKLLGKVYDKALETCPKGENEQVVV